MVRHITMYVVIVLATLVIFGGCKKEAEGPVVGAVTLTVDQTSVTNESVDLSWTRYTDVRFKAYEIHSSTSQNFTPSEGTLYETQDLRTDTTTIVFDLLPDMRYYFKIRVTTTDGRFSDSNEGTAKTDP